MRFIAEARIRTRCVRWRSRSRNSRSLSDGTHSSGTRSRRHNSGRRGRRPCRSCTPAARRPEPCARARSAPAAGRGERVADPDGAAHRLHHRPHVHATPDHQAHKAVLVGRHDTLTDDLAGLAERAPGRTAIGPINTDILHGMALFAGRDSDDLSVLRGGPLHDIPWNPRVRSVRSPDVAVSSMEWRSGASVRRQFSLLDALSARKHAIYRSCQSCHCAGSVVLRLTTRGCASTSLTFAPG